MWTESSRLETLTQGTTTTGFLYDADGNRVARRDSGVTTVMIDNTFEWSSAGGLVSDYAHGGQVIAMRNTTGLHWRLHRRTLRGHFLGQSIPWNPPNWDACGG
jgi:YD repeat-containing protein